MYKETIDYKFIDIENSDVTAIQLLIKNYENVIYHYHKARIVEDNGVGRLQFGYTILDPGEHDIDSLNNNEYFHTIMGDILTILLMSKAKDDESFRDNNTKKLDLQ
jgi:hypothetical protein